MPLVTFERVAAFADDLPAGAAGDASDLPTLEQRIVAAVAYRDMFQFAPDAAEITRYLPHLQSSEANVHAALAGGRLVPEILVTDGQYYALKGREAFFALRRERREIARTLRAKAVRTAARIASLPFVQMIALTGSLAAENPDPDADLDVIIVTDAGRLWRVNAVTSTLRFIDQHLGPRHFCPNVMRSKAALEFENHRLYTAQEMAMMVPLFGYDTYLEIFDRNPWVHTYLPNCEPFEAPADLVASPLAPGSRDLLEAVFNSAAGQQLERIWYDRRVRQHRDPDHRFHRYTPFTPEAQGLYVDMGEAIEGALNSRLAQVGLPPLP